MHNSTIWGFCCFLSILIFFNFLYFSKFFWFYCGFLELQQIFKLIFLNFILAFYGFWNFSSKLLTVYISANFLTFCFFLDNFSIVFCRRHGQILGNPCSRLTNSSYHLNRNNPSFVERIWLLHGSNTADIVLGPARDCYHPFDWLPSD